MAVWPGCPGHPRARPHRQRSHHGYCVASRYGSCHPNGWFASPSRITAAVLDLLLYCGKQSTRRGLEVSDMELAAFAQCGLAGPRPASPLLLLARCCSCRFTAYYWISFVSGLAVAHQLTVWWAVASVPLWLAFCLGTEAVNRLADREADVINQPERTAMCAAFGWSRLGWVAALSWVAFGVIGAAMLYARPSVMLAVLLVVDAFIAVGYSVGPTFKRRRVLALLALTTALILPMITGWALTGEVNQLVRPVLPAAGVLLLFSISLSGIKDITDVEGDRLLNYSSLWLQLIKIRRGVVVYAAIGLPFAFVGACSTLGLLPLTSLAVTPLVVVSALVVTAAARATSAVDREMTREVMHAYTFFFMVLFLLSTIPTQAMIVAAAAASAYWVVASRALHWSGGLDRAKIRRVREMLMSSEPQESLDELVVRAGIHEVVAQVLTMPVAEIGADADFYDDLGGDSLQKLEVITRVESMFCRRFTDEQAAASNTVDELTRQVLRHAS